MHKFLLALLLFVYIGASAQSTNPSPYCYPVATGMTSGTCTGSGSVNGYGFGLKSVKLNTLSQTSGCYGSGNTDVYRYWSATTSLNVNVSYVMTIQTQSASGNNQVGLGVWIDFDQSNTFESSELLYSTTSGTLGNQGGFYIYIPCTAKAGKTRMRVRSQGYRKITGGDSCKAQSGYGETWDFDVTIVQQTKVTSAFTIPTQAFVKTAVLCLNSSRSGEGYSQYAWDANNDGVYEQKGNNPDFNFTWNTTGTKCVKLRNTNCYGVDSTVQCLTIVAPTAIPEADFVSCNRFPELYAGTFLTDMSTNGAYQWEWYVYDSITFKNDPYDKVSNEQSGYVLFTNGTTRYSKNPRLEFYRDGNYTVELKATNGIGTSVIKKKQFYFKFRTSVNPIQEFLLGKGTYGKNLDNRVEDNFGNIMDDGGNANTYSHNQGVNTKAYLIINPTVRRPISLTFEQIKLKNTGDSIKIYDDDKPNGKKLLGILTSNDNGTFPVYKSTINRMYVLFRSDSSGTDSGFKAQFTNSANFISNMIEISISQKMLPNKQFAFYNEVENASSYNADRIWSVNDTVQDIYTNTDTLVYKFKYTGVQKVCLEMKGCDTTVKKCINYMFDSGLSGVVFKDNNADCELDNGDFSLQNVPLKLYDSVLNNWSYSVSDAKGNYGFDKKTGTYKVMVDTANYPFKVKCGSPAGDSIFSLTGSDPLKTIHFNMDINCQKGKDLGVQSIWTNGMVFPGRLHTLWVYAGDMDQWYGLSCASGDSGKVVITVSGKQNFIKKEAGSLTPSSISGNKFTYLIKDFSKIKGATDFGLVFQTDAKARGGDITCVTVQVIVSGIDRDTTNNTSDFCYRILNSYDPNFKEVTPVELTEGYKDWLTYTVHFQNTGDAPAYDIRLEDTLDSRLDLSTFQLVNYSHPVSTALKDNILSFMFKDIMLPDSNSDEPGSHGFVQFRIKPKTRLAKGIIIKNTAYIYFDFNDPVATNTVANEVAPNRVLIPDPAFAAWLSMRYPSCMYKGNLMDTSCSDIKNELNLDVAGKNIADLFGIQFFTSLETLKCNNNLLTTLPQLSASVSHVNCSGNKLASLAALPNALQVLLCYNNNLTSLPSLPAGLNYLSCSDNGMSSLPALSNALEDLYCDRNQLTALPALPDNLNMLSCIRNKISVLPALPASMTTLICDSNQLSVLPSLPSGLGFLSCGYNQLTELPVLPAGLSSLYCNNNKILCFDKFSDNISAINISNNSYKCLPNYISAMDAATKSAALCIKGDKVNNPDNCLSTVTSVNDVKSVADITVYPNPGKGVYAVALPENYRGLDMKIEVYNVLGEMVAICSVKDNITLVDLSSNSNGVYLLKIIGANTLLSKYLIKE